MNISSLAEMNIEAVNYVISAKDVSADAIKTATSGIKKFETDTKTVTDRMSSHWESYKSSYIKATAAIAIATATMMKVWSMAKIGAQFEEQRGILDNLSRKYSMTADSIVASMEKASTGLIAKADLMQVALGGIAKGLKPEQLINLAGAANILGDAVGKTATEALRDLTEALESGRARGLKTYLGTTLDLKSAFGDLESKMTDVEKAQAMYNLTMITATNLQAQQTKAVDESADKIERIEKKFNDATLAISRFMKAVVVSIIDAPAKFNAMAASVDLLTGEIIPATIDYADALYDEKKNVDSVTAAYQAQIDALKKTLQGREDEKKAIKDEAAAEEWRKNQAIQWAREETEAKIKENQAMVKDMEETTKKIFEEREKYRNYRFKREEELRKYLEDTDKKLIERAKATNAEMIRRAELHAQALELIEKRKLEKKLEYQDTFAKIMDMANAAGGGIGQGVGQMGASLKGIAEIVAGQDEYTKRSKAAFDHFLELKTLYAQDYEDRKEVGEALTAWELAEEQRRNGQKLSMAQNFAGAMAGTMYALYQATGQQSEAMFRIYQAAAIAETVIATYKAAQDAYAWGWKYGGPYAPALAMAMGAVAVVAGMARVAAIASQTIGGGAATAATPSGGGGYAYNQPAEPGWKTTEKERPAPIIHITILGNIVDQGQFVRDIIPEIRKAYSDDVH